MKKILLLGGSRYLLPVIKVAKELGAYVYTCDYLPDNYAHKYADEYINVSITDKEAVLNIAKEKEIDGIMSFGTDPGVVTASYVAEKLGLPNTGPYKSVEILQNKNLFRAYLKEHGFNVPYFESFKKGERPENLPYPVIVKPTDSAGSKGVSKVNTPQELDKAIEYALEYSRNNIFIIEEFIEPDGCPSDSECFSIDGELVFSSWNSQYFDTNAENPFAPAGFTWPSSMNKEQTKELHSELKRLLRLLNMGSSIYNVESRADKNGKVFLMEVSPRGGGNRLAEMVRYCTGTDLIKESVKAALGIPVNSDNYKRKIEEGWVELILHSRKSGIFEKIEICKEVLPYLVEEDLWISRGDEVESFSGANKTIGTLIFNTKDDSLARKILKNPDNYVKVIIRD